ncbi:MAG TPA: hypothetical protein PKW55_02070 [Spirochaetota bacterium]|nr:hypothetical protein [Spirochaetota bacterium]HOM38362.1 hypothetical protein [Spirochaetota bacterium]HPQ48420.1 hypothetical protein [Spirochaetota bacterium]
MKTHSKIGLRKAFEIIGKNGIEYHINKNKDIKVGKYIITPSFILKNVISYLGCFRKQKCYYSFLLIRSGLSIMAVFKWNKLIDYRIIKRYTVRKTQGKSQDKHLKKKGKSRLGSRIRLRELKLFIGETKEMIRDFIKVYGLCFVFVGIPKNRIEVIKDINLSFIKIPFHFNRPSIKELKRIVKNLYYSSVNFNS